MFIVHTGHKEKVLQTWFQEYIRYQYSILFTVHVHTYLLYKASTLHKYWKIAKWNWVSIKGHMGNLGDLQTALKSLKKLNITILGPH